MPKTTKQLTDTEILKAKPRAKIYKLHDGKGLVVLIRPSGTKTFQHRYIINGKAKISTIGQYGKAADCINLDLARKILAEQRAMIKAGDDPALIKAENKAERQYIFREVADEWMLKQDWVPAHRKRILQRLNKDFFPQIGDIPIADIKRVVIRDIIDKIYNRGAKNVANRACQSCTQIFEYAIISGYCEANVAAGLSKVFKAPESENHAYMSEKELEQFVYALYSDNEKAVSRLAVKLFLLFFTRHAELRKAKWDEVKVSEQILVIPKERMKLKKNLIVPLSSQALNILTELKQLCGDSEYLFPSPQNKSKPISDVTILTKAKSYYKEKSITLHGFRHTASTILNELGKRSDAIEAQMSHTDPNSVRKIYNKAEYLPERKEIMQFWADHLDVLFEKGKNQ